MKRKIVTLLLALSIATISITACGKKVTTEPTEQLETINTETNQEPNSDVDAGDFYYGGYQSPEELDRREAWFEEETSIEKFAEENLPGEGTTMKRFQAWVREQGADWAAGWTFIYMNGKAAGDQPTYGVYMKPDSPLYGTVYHVGDTIPDGSRLDGTREEEDALLLQSGLKKAEENGDLYIDPETGKRVINIGD